MNSSQPRRRHPRRDLAIGSALLLLVWCVILPWIARLPIVADWIAGNAQRGIDPSAMYYTELEGMRFLDRPAPPRETR